MVQPRGAFVLSYPVYDIQGFYCPSEGGEFGKSFRLRKSFFFRHLALMRHEVRNHMSLVNFFQMDVRK